MQAGAQMCTHLFGYEPLWTRGHFNGAAQLQLWGHLRMHESVHVCAVVCGSVGVGVGVELCACMRGTQEGRYTSLPLCECMSDWVALAGSLCFRASSDSSVFPKHYNVLGNMTKIFLAWLWAHHQINFDML